MFNLPRKNSLSSSFAKEFYFCPYQFSILPYVTRSTFPLRDASIFAFRPLRLSPEYVHADSVGGTRCGER